MRTLPKFTLRTLTPLAAVAVAGTLLASGAAGQPSATAHGGSVQPAGDHARFDTVFASPLGIEGLTGRDGFLYVAGRGTDSCPVWRVPVHGGAAVVVGQIPSPCAPSGLTFDAAGRLFVADRNRVDTLTPDPANPPTATVFTSDVPNANGLAFDRAGNLWVSDGTAGQGRVWRVGRDGVPVEMFRVQPMANDVNVADGAGGVGRDVRSLPPGTVNFTPNGRVAANTAGSQSLVANGLAFTPDGRTLYVADTARGAIWKVRLGPDGIVRSPVGCDATFAPDTLCLDDVFVVHPYLEGSDGIVLDRAGNIWAAANERNAVVVVSPSGRVREFFRSPVDPTTRLRNNGPLEFPTSPFIAGHTLCLTQSNGNRRDNVPNSGGEVGPGHPAVAKISCLRQRLGVPGLPLPIG